jgi:hypothetical protein
VLFTQMALKIAPDVQLIASVELIECRSVAARVAPDEPTVQWLACRLRGGSRRSHPTSPVDPGRGNRRVDTVDDEGCPVVADQAQKHFLGNVIEVSCRTHLSACKEPTQRLLPVAEPIRQRTSLIAISYQCQPPSGQTYAPIGRPVERPNWPPLFIGLFGWRAEGAFQPTLYLEYLISTGKAAHA